MPRGRNAVSRTPGTSNRHRTLFGAFAGAYNYPNDPYETKEQMRARVCAAYGVASLPVERLFNEATWRVPPSGSPFIVSFAQDPSAVAAGVFDTEITTFVESLDPQTTYWLCLNHECDQTSRSYTPEEQVAGFRQFATVVRAVGMPHVKLASIMMSWTLGRGDDVWRQWYAGPEYVDALGWDAYWRPTLEHDVADVYGPAMDVTRAEGMPLLICETSMGAQGHGGQEFVDGAYVEIPEDVWMQFVTDAIAFLDVPGTAAVTWFETHKIDGHWRLQSHPDALAVWSEAVAASPT